MLHELAPIEIRTDSDSLISYGRDWTRHYTVAPLAIAFPKTTSEVAAIVRWARKHKTPLVPSGGRTGLSGGAVASHRELVVSFEKMNQFLEFNEIDQTLTCQAGVTTQAVQEKAAQYGAFFPVDFASKGSSQIGGNVATNAGGIRVIRYGVTRNWVQGLKFVSGTGEIITANRGLIKNSTGYDLRHLLIGSEGTLGLITEVTLGLTHPQPQLNTFLATVHTLEAAVDFFLILKKHTKLHAIEVFSDTALKKVMSQNHLRNPFQSPSNVHLLIEAEGSQEALQEAILPCYSDGLINETIFSQSTQQTRDFWSYRERITESLAPYFPIKTDVAVRISKLSPFVNALDSELVPQLQNLSPGTEMIWFGHLGDGNLHINFIHPAGGQTNSRVLDLLYQLIQRFEGSISAEHGIGLTKRDYLENSRTPAEIDLFRRIKSAFDPDGILNPGKIFKSTKDKNDQ